MAKSLFSTEKKCYICGTSNWIEKHHIFGGANRKNSEKYGLYVNLCHTHHNEPPNGVHHNRSNDIKLKQEGQRRFKKAYPNLDFLKIFGRNYL